MTISGNHFSNVAARMGAQPAHAASLQATVERYNILTDMAQAVFLGQLHVETMGFRRAEESFDYAADRLQSVFGKRITLAEAQQHGRIDRGVRLRTKWKLPDQPANVEAIANIVYGREWGNRHLGNTQPGDGWMFRGRGDIQLTGRSNYEQYSRHVFRDTRLIEMPYLVMDYPHRSHVAGWFWQTRECGKLITDRLESSVRAVTKKINGGDHGLDARLAQAQRALHFLQETSP